MVQGFESGEPSTGRCMRVTGPVIVGAGPSGLAVASGLIKQVIPFVILERANCIAPLWQECTYDRLKLQLPKQYCELPDFPFSTNCPEYPSRTQFIAYLESYAKHFGIIPQLNETAQSAKYDQKLGLWRVKTIREGSSEVEYVSRWIVAATGENAYKIVPKFEGLEDFGGHVVHSCDYRSGESYNGQKVLVIGCGISGVEIAVDLCDHNASPFMVVRNSVTRARLIMGSLELRNNVIEKIRSGQINVVPGIRKFSRGGVELVDGQVLQVDSVVLATGYRSNVPSWLKENELFSDDGFPKNPFPNGWKGTHGLYAVGFTMRGLVGASLDAINVSRDIGKGWKEEIEQNDNAWLHSE